MKKFLSIAVICCVVAMSGIFTSCEPVEDGDWIFSVKLDPNTEEGLVGNYYMWFDQVVIDNMKASANSYKSHPGVLMGGLKINLFLENRDTNQDELILSRTLKQD